MICPKCGNSVPDGTPCPCGAPVLSTNPALQVLKTVASSPRFLALAILLSVSTVFSIIASCTVGDNLAFLYENLANYGVDTYAMREAMEAAGSTSVVSAVLGSIPTILLVVGAWMHYATCRSTASGNISTAGLTICKVLTILEIIGISLGVLGVLILLVVGIIGAGVSANQPYDEWSGLAAVGSGLLIVVSIVLLALFVLLIVYDVCQLKIINRVKSTALSGIPDGRISQFYIVLSFIFAIFGILGGIVSLFGNVWQGLSGLTSSVVLLLSAMCLSEYKKKIALLMNPVNQSPYQVPPMQP